MAQDENRPIIIKKVKKGGRHGHHGGAWKVAYADFVTAMMAFFLLLWLLNATTEEQKRGIADYFSPHSIAPSSSGAGGVMGGQSMNLEGSLNSDRSPVGITVSIPSSNEEEDPTEQAEESEAATKRPGELSEEALERELAEREAAQFEAAEGALRQAIQNVPELRGLVENLVIDQTSQGLRIQIVDREKTSMFPSGSAQMYGRTQQLMELVADAIANLPNRVAIKGHTDATPFSSGSGYSNWELSTDRANASRRALLDAGLDPRRIESVAGRADQEPLIADDPYSPRNRRISVVLLRENKTQIGGSGDGGDSDG
ncbi:MAG: flagellar motor protein MotB [Kiloniellales bacterium]|nr:flagellar motor protein MotB [Kiloniellales bacterium]